MSSDGTSRHEDVQMAFLVPLLCLAAACYASGRVARIAEYRWAFLWSLVFLVGLLTLNLKRPDAAVRFYLPRLVLNWPMAFFWTCYGCIGFGAAGMAQDKNKKIRAKESDAEAAVELIETGVEVLKDVHDHFHF